MPPSTSRSSRLERYGLHRPELRTWVMYDWANPAFMTTVVAAVFPIYFARVAAVGLPPATATFRFGLATTIALAIVAITAPVFGAIADHAAYKKRLLFAFQTVGVGATAGMSFIGQGDWLMAIALFMLGNIGVYGALWWMVFSLPLFLRVPEPPRGLGPDEQPDLNLVAVGFSRLGNTLGELRRFLLFNDGISTIIPMAAIFGTEIGIETGHLITALLLAQVVGIPCSFLFGRVAGWMGTKAAIFLTLGCYTGISVLGYFMSTAAHFYGLAVLVGTVQGGSQALSRSLFATMVPRHKSSEFFGFFGVSEKFAGIIGPLVFAGVVARSGSSRSAVLSVTIFFIAGAIVLSRVEVDERQRVARDAGPEAR